LPSLTLNNKEIPSELPSDVVRISLPERVLRQYCEMQGYEYINPPDPSANKAEKIKAERERRPSKEALATFITLLFEEIAKNKKVTIEYK